MTPSDYSKIYCVNVFLPNFIFMNSQRLHNHIQVLNFVMER